MNTKTITRVRTPFLSGCIDSIPICVSFGFVFFSVGSLCATYGFTSTQAAAMTATIFAGPLQVFIVQSGESVTLWGLLIASFLINFRFLIMASALSEKFRDVPLFQLLLSIPMLSASTFTLANRKDEEPGSALFGYYLGVGGVGMLVAIIATLAGTVVASRSDPFVTALVNMILPIHFTVLMAIGWPKLRPIIVTVVSFFLAPIAGHWLGSSQLIILPIVVAIAFLGWDQISGRVK
jgi:predicted branched-subunit amino acid permease